jgi:hypothetical protein
MHNRPKGALLSSTRRTAGRALLWLAAWLPVSLVCGCASLTNPVGGGIPVQCLSPELLAIPREIARPIPLNLLRQKPPDVYLLAPGDVLGVWIEGVLGEQNQSPPVRLPERADLPTGLGYPIPVRANGTVSLPFVAPINVRGLSVEAAEEAIRRAYSRDKRILRPGRERIIVTLLRRRQYQVLVFRQDASGELALENQDVGFTFGPGGYAPGSQEVLRSTKRSTGYAVDLPAYENDVLHALSRTGGLPGLDSANEIVLQRGFLRGEQDWATVIKELQGWPPNGSTFMTVGPASQVIRIPLRVLPGEEFSLRPEDIILETGDILFVPPRKPEVYYAAGLLPVGGYLLPRDRDLNVLEAIAQIRGPLVNGAFAVNNISGAIIAPGIGGPSPSLLSVLRKTPDGGQVIIRVNLNKALRDPRERLLVQAGDFLILQETPFEALQRYFSQVFKFSFFWQVIHGPHENGTANLLVP